MDEGGRVPLLAHHLAADYDTAAKEDLRVRVITLPVYGCIENTRTGKLLGCLIFLLADERERRHCHAEALSPQFLIAELVVTSQFIRSALQDKLSLGSIAS